jgi:CheY-like chemotaxis protein
MSNKIKTILLADDDQDYKYFFYKALSEVDPDVTLITASDGEEALGAAAVSKPDLIILDYNMPVMNAATYLKKTSNTPLHSRVIVYSGFMNMIDERALLSAGAERVCTKPDTFQATIKLIVDILSFNGRECA